MPTTRGELSQIEVARDYECGVLFSLTVDLDGEGGKFDVWVSGEWSGFVAGALPDCVLTVRKRCRERAESNVWLALHEDPTHGNKA